eukprot:12893505-Prorocentrum_lima.AAC.1
MESVVARSTINVDPGEVFEDEPIILDMPKDEVIGPLPNTHGVIFADHPVLRGVRGPNDTNNSGT